MGEQTVADLAASVYLGFARSARMKFWQKVRIRAGLKSSFGERRSENRAKRHIREAGDSDPSPGNRGNC